MKLIRSLAISVAAITILASCSDQDLFSDIHVKPNTTLPIGTAVITDSTLFAMAGVEDQLFTDPNGVINFFTGGNYKAISQDNIDRVLALNFNPYQFSFPIQLPPAPVQYIPVPENTKQAYYMNYNDGTVLDLLQLTQGSIRFTINNPNNLDFSRLLCTVPQITKGGRPLTLIVGQTVTLDKSYSIAPAQDGAFSNRIELHFLGMMPYTSDLSGVVSIQNAKLYHAEGFFGSSKLVASQTVKIEPSDPAFNDLIAQSNYVYFANPNIKFDVGNELDIPVLIDISTLEIDGQPIILKPTIGARKHLVAPKSHTQLSITNASTQSGLAFSTAITKNFKSISVGISSYINPTTADVEPSYTPPLKNSITNTDTLGVKYNVNLPFECILDQLPFVQEIDINLSDMASDKDTQYKLFQMRFTGTNELPVKIVMNPYVTADNNPNSTPIYLLNKPITIEPTASYLRPGTSGFVPYTISKDKPILIDVVADKIQSMLNAKKIFMNLTTSTRGADNHNPINSVKIYSPSNLKLDVTIGAQADINISPSNK